ncbi:MAG: MFS transporter [Candidatus Pacearchaeota archaeon]
MGFLIRKQRGFFSFTGIARLSIITFIISLSYSLVDTIWAIYLGGIFNNVSIISFFSAFLTIIAFFSYFFFVPLIEKNSKSRLFATSLIFVGLSYLIFILNKSLTIFFIAAISLTIFTTLRINSFGIIVRDKSHKKNLSRNEGLLYTFFNIAWLIGPLISGLLAEAYGINFIFILSAIFIFLGLFLFWISRIKDLNIKKRADNHVIKNFFAFFKSGKRRFAYFIGGGVNFWFILIYLYMPLLILENGLREVWIGYFLFATAIPVVFLEYPMSKLAGKIGFKRIFKIGFLILAVASLACFFIESIYIILAILVFASIGVSMIEPTTEAYFFDILKTKEEESRFYGPYNTTIDVNNFIGKVLIGLLLFIFPLKFIFLFFFAFMFIYFLISAKIKDVKEWRRK